MGELHSSSRVKNTSDNKNALPLTVKIAGAAIFSAMSLVVSLLTTEVLPRFAWGLAWFDPVSVIWILSFFVFGYEAGLITSFVGMFLLFPFDGFSPWGPMFKFLATVPLILVPLLMQKIRKQEINNESILNTKNLIVNWLVSVALRVVIMIPVNIISIMTIVPNLWGINLWEGDAANLNFLGIDSVNGWTAIIITVLFVNVLQSVSDYLVPYLLIKPIQVGIPNLIQW